MALGACSRGGAGGAGGASPFDKRWDVLAQQGAQAIRVVADEQGAALMDNVLGAQSGAVAMAPLMAESLKGGARSGPLPDRPDANEVQKLVRQYVPGVKSCYQRMTREGDTRTGKAIVSFQIAQQRPRRRRSASTRPPSTAPSSRAASTGRCRAGSSRRRATARLPTSYPFVFVGRLSRLAGG